MNTISVLHINLFEPEKEASGFYFSTLKNHLVNSHKHIEKPHRHDFFVTVIFTAGQGIHEIDFQKYDVSAGSIFFLAPGQVHSWELSADTDGYIFFFSQPYYELHYVNQKLKDFPFFNAPGFSRKLQLQSEELLSMIHLFQAIECEHQSQKVMKQNFILSLITQIYIHAVREFSKDDQLIQASNSAYFKHYQDFENLLETFFVSEKSISYYASMMDISPKHLNRITQTTVQKTASQVITDRVMLEAKRMLIYLDEDLVEIAFRLGYEEYSYFARVFRKNTGITPSHFVKNHRG